MNEIDQLIYHIVLPETWEQAAGNDNYEADSLHTEGFIHCSYENQLGDVIDRYYKGVPRVNVLVIDPRLLSSELVAEASTGGEIYPHIYGPINRSAIVDVEDWALFSV